MRDKLYHWIIGILTTIILAIGIGWANHVDGELRDLKQANKDLQEQIITLQVMTGKILEHVEVRPITR